MKGYGLGELVYIKEDEGCVWMSKEVTRTGGSTTRAMVRKHVRQGVDLWEILEVPVKSTLSLLNPRP